MNCLLVIPSLNRAGAQTQAVDLANGLAARGISTHLCVFERSLDQLSRLSSAVHVHRLRRKRRYDRALISAMADIIDEHQIDVVQGILQYAVFFAWLASRRSRRRPPVVAAVHTTIPRNRTLLLQDRLVYRPILRRLPAVIFVSERQREYWIRKSPELLRSSIVVHNGIDPIHFRIEAFNDAGRALRDTLEIPPDAFVFACIAGFRPEKGHDLLLRALSLVPQTVHLLLAGDGPLLPQVEADARRAQFAARVRFLGSVGDVRPLIAASDATVLASTAVETFSMAMLESMSMGVPVIGPDIGGLSEAIISGETGLLFPAGDASALAAAMETMAEHPSDTERMGCTARQLVVSRFTVDRMVGENEQVLRRVVSMRRPRPHQ